MSDTDVIKEMRWQEIKRIRDRLLKESDYTQVADAPLSVDNVAGFAVYRDELRKLPQTYNNPEDVVWPIKP